MLLFIVLWHLLCLVLPASAFPHVTTPEDPVDLAAHHVKRLSNPPRNLLHKRDATLSASGTDASRKLALDSTNGVLENLAFESTIDIPGEGDVVYFVVKGEIDSTYKATIEFWYEYHYDRRIGVYEGDLGPGVDMKIADSSKIMQGEALVFAVERGEWMFLVFEAHCSVHLPSSPTKQIPPFSKAIKVWKAGNLMTMQDVPGTLATKMLSNFTIMDTSVSSE